MKHNFLKYLGLFFCSGLLTLVSCDSIKNEKTNAAFVETDSIAFYVDKASKKTTEIDERKFYLLKAYTLNNKIKQDSLKNKNLLKIAYQSYKQKDNALFLKINMEAQLLSTKVSDTFGIADTHWNFGNYFSKREVTDSAYYHYYKAEQSFSKIDNSYYSAKMLYNMAIIQFDIRDYTGSEVLTFNAISKFKDLNKYLNLYRCYNHLGVIYKEFEEYDRSIFYYNMALEYLEKVPNKLTFREGTLNNIGKVYSNSLNHKKAIEYFQEGLSNDSLKLKDIDLYAKLFDNLTYSRFLNGVFIGIENDFNTALKIRDSVNNVSGILINKLHLAEFYAKNDDTTKAINYAIEARTLAKKIHNNRDNLAALKLLSKIDKHNANDYLSTYAELSENLQKEDRKIREKFTRIRFETDEYVEETERLSQQKIWIITIAMISIIMLSLLYYLKQQRSRNKELVFEAKQQTYNEEIYKLMLKQQANLKKGRLEERTRISEELHDGVLSKLFGTRMGIGFLNLQGDETTLKQHGVFINELQEVEKEIRVISHELKNEVLDTQVDFLSLIENLLEKQSLISQYSYKISSGKNIRWDDIDENIKIHLYRIIQEGLSNISKYSKAKNVKINFKMKDKLFILTLEDDGVGFDKLKKIRGIGLSNMQSRTQKLKGDFSVDSTLGDGTKLTVSIFI